MIDDDDCIHIDFCSQCGKRVEPVAVVDALGLVEFCPECFFQMLTAEITGCDCPTAS